MEHQDVITAALAHLPAYGVVVADLQTETRLRANLRADAKLTLTAGHARFSYLVEEKRSIIPTTLGGTLTQIRDLARAADMPVLLVTDHLTAPVAEKLKNQGQQFLDAAGNAYLEGDGIFVWVCGRKRPPMFKPQQAGAFTTGGTKVLFALLRNPELAGAAQRKIAEVAGVALGTVSGVLKDLTQKDYLIGKGSQRRIIAVPSLLDEWTRAYGRTLYPRTLLRTLTTPDFKNWESWELTPHAVLWGAEPAAKLLVGHLRPGELTLYTHNMPTRVIAEHRMTEPEPGVTQRLVRVRRIFWGSHPESVHTHPVTHPLLVYADLLATGDGRCIETAELIRDKYLARLLTHD